MDNSIKKDNKIPGSERLTRPEEISALSKFLGHIRKVQEEHTELDLTEIEVPGITTGLLPDINKLPDSTINLEVSDKLDLDSTLIKLEDTKKNIKLEDTIINLESDNDIELEQEKIKLEVEDKTELSKSKVNLSNTGDKELELETKREDLTLDKTELELPTTSETLKNIDEIIRLEDQVELLSNTEKDIELETSISKLENVNKDNNLSDTKIKLNDVKETKNLKTDKVKLTGDLIEVNELYDSNIELATNNEVTKLEDTVKEVVGQVNEVSSLSNILDSITDPYNNSPQKLESKVDNINKPFDNSPSELYDEDKRLGIIDSENNNQIKKLETTRKDLSNIEDINNLHSNSVKISGDAYENFPTELYGEDDIVRTNPSFKEYNEFKDLLEQSDLDKYKKALEGLADNKSDFTNFNSKMGSLLSTIYNQENITPEQFNNFKEIIRESVSILPKNDKTETNGEEKLRVHGEGVCDNSKEWLEKFGIGFFSGATSNDYGWPVGVPKYDAPYNRMSGTALGLSALDPNNYLRYLAEEIVWGTEKGFNDKGIGMTGSTRTMKSMLLDMTLASLVLARDAIERKTKTTRSQLPGTQTKGQEWGAAFMQGGVQGVVEKGLGKLDDIIAGRPDNGPSNNPNSVNALDGPLLSKVGGEKNTKIIDKGRLPGYELDTEGIYLQDANVRDYKSNKKIENPVSTYYSPNRVINRPIKSLDYETIMFESSDGTHQSYKKSYVNSSGIALTLSDLCKTDISSLECFSVENLLELLKNSDYITTPGKLGIMNGIPRTLDSNNFWEITMEPFCSETNDNFCSNGGYSFLPAIQEINLINKIEHGVKTAYSKWIPFNSFELQKARLNSKTLGLFDGEIAYPISSELSNELRLVLIDDQYKSWRNYFQKCADVSIYSSESHTKDWYNGNNATRATIVDKSNIIVSCYKNITFLINIYVMTPQYSTVRKYPLLCVLRDFQEEYSGDIDAPGTDLSLIFSIVGEYIDKNKSTIISNEMTVKNRDITYNYYRQNNSFTPLGQLLPIPNLT